MYDYDACLLYSPQASEIVEAVVARLISDVHLVLARQPLKEEGNARDLTEILGVLARSATCVLFLDTALVASAGG